MWYGLVTGLFIGIMTASLIIVFLRIMPMTPMLMVGILYLYALVGGLTGFFVERKLSKWSKSPIAGKVKDDDTRSQKLINVAEYSSLLNSLSDLKTTVIMIKCVLEVRKKLDMAKIENMRVLDHGIGKMDERASALNYEYLKAEGGV